LQLQTLQIRNFRNLVNIDYQAGSSLNVLVGNNAQGKTNFLEAIYLLSTGKSFRTALDEDLIQYNAGQYKIYSQYQMKERKLSSLLYYKRAGGKSFFINNKEAPFTHSDRLRVVLFHPDDLFLVKGPPSGRRAFLDFVLRQLSLEYQFYLENYNKILRKRNFYLKNEQTKSKSFSIINEVFVEQASRVMMQRIQFTSILDEICGPLYRAFSQEKNHLRIRYAISFPVKSDKINLDILQNAMMDDIKNRQEKERTRKTSLVGPHLDDLHFYQDDRLARIYASQGQQRNIAVTLKLAELHSYKRIGGEYPLFLLDEVLAELDKKRRTLLLEYLKDAAFQTFLTSVAWEGIDQLPGTVFAVQEGNLIRREFS